MSAEHTHYAINAPGLKPTERLILLLLANYTDMDGECWPSQDTIAEKVGVSRTWVCLMIAELKKKGHLDILRGRKGKGRAVRTYYKLTGLHQNGELSGGGVLTGVNRGCLVELTATEVTREQEDASHLDKAHSTLPKLTPAEAIECNEMLASFPHRSEPTGKEMMIFRNLIRILIRKHKLTLPVVREQIQRFKDFVTELEPKCVWGAARFLADPELVLDVTRWRQLDNRISEDNMDAWMKDNGID